MEHLDNKCTIIQHVLFKWSPHQSPCNITLVASNNMGPVGPIRLGPVGPFIWAQGPSPLGSFICDWTRWDPHGPILGFCHKRGEHERWGAVRHVGLSGNLTRVFLEVEHIIKNIGFQTCGRFITYLNLFLEELCFSPKKIPDVFGTTAERFYTILEKFWLQIAGSKYY